MGGRTASSGKNIVPSETMQRVVKNILIPAGVYEDSDGEQYVVRYSHPNEMLQKCM